MKTITHKFVELIPEELEEGLVYVSIKYHTATHKCICGCGNIVVTPITPDSWTLSFNGKTISLHPSIGNWNFECKSHYFIKNNAIVMAKKWSDYKQKESKGFFWSKSKKKSKE